MCRRGRGDHHRFDVGRSFAYNQLNDRAFDFSRGARRQQGGNRRHQGTVYRDSSSGRSPRRQCDGECLGGGPSNWFILSTGKTDATGHYRLAYLLPGAYIVGVDPPASMRSLAPSLDSNVAVNQGHETIHD